MTRVRDETLRTAPAPASPSPAAPIPAPGRCSGHPFGLDVHRVDPPDFPADPTLSASLLRRLRPATLEGSQIAEGPTTTCESISAETWEDVQEWSRQGYLGVGMEAALTFAVGAHFATSAAAVLFVADNLIVEVGFFDAAHAESAARARAQQLQYDVALAELLQPGAG